MKLWEELSTEEKRQITEQIALQIYLETKADQEYDAWCNNESSNQWWDRQLKPKRFYFCSKCDEKFDKRMGRVCPICSYIMKPVS